MNKKIVIPLVLLFSFALLASATDTATLTYSLDDQQTGITTVVKRVPFSVFVDLGLSRTGQNYATLFQFNVFSQVTGASNVIESNSRGVLLNACSDNNLIFNNFAASGNNALWRYYIDAGCGISNDVNQGATIRISTLKVKATNPGAVSSTSSTSFNGPGGITYALTTNNAFSFTPVDDTCGNGVVGFLESGVTDYYNDNRKERCDEGPTATGGNKNTERGGCAEKCNYVEIGWSCGTRSSFGDRKTICTKMDAKTLLKGKLTKIIDGECYPDRSHPVALYCQNGSPLITYDSNGKLSVQEKYYVISQIGVALTEFFQDVLE